MSEVYQMDAYRKVYASLCEDPNSWFINREHMPEEPVTRAIYREADKLNALTPTKPDLMLAHSYAYWGGAAMVVAAFKESNLSHEETQSTINDFPDQQFDQDYVLTARAVKLAREGIDAHPELKHHLDLTVEYFINRVLIDRSYSDFAAMGIGHTALRLDTILWSNRIEQRLGQRPNKINWDEVFKKP